MNRSPHFLKKIEQFFLQILEKKLKELVNTPLTNTSADMDIQSCGQSDITYNINYCDQESRVITVVDGDGNEVRDCELDEKSVIDNEDENVKYKCFIVDGMVSHYTSRSKCFKFSAANCTHVTIVTHTTKTFSQWQSL